MALHSIVFAVGGPLFFAYVMFSGSIEPYAGWALIAFYGACIVGVVLCGLVYAGRRFPWMRLLGRNLPVLAVGAVGLALPVVAVTEPSLAPNLMRPLLMAVFFGGLIGASFMTRRLFATENAPA